MKRRLFGTVAASALALVLAGCLDDPTASLRGDVARVEITRSYVELDVGESLTLEARSYDAQGNLMSVLPEVTSSDAALLSVTVDPRSGDPQPRTIFTVTALQPGSATLTASAGGVSSTASTVILFPILFNGTVSVDQTGAMDEITVSASAALTFDETASEVYIDGDATYLVSRTASQLVVRSLSKDAITGGTVTVTNLIFSVGDLPIAELDATDPVSVRGEPNEPNDAYGQAIVVTPGQATFMGALGAGGADASDWFEFTVGAATDITITVAFADNPDVDLEIYDASGNWLGIYSWYDNPEVVSQNFAAGTYKVLVYLYDIHGDPAPTWYTFSITSP